MQKLDVRKIVATVVFAALGSVAICLLYLGILFFSLPFANSITVSWILSLSITAAILLCLGHTLKTKKKREA